MYLFIFLLTLCLAISFAKPKADLKPFSVEALMPLRGVLAVFIVLHHCVLRTDGAGADVPWVLSQFSFMGAPVVAVFFFLSGYGLTRSLKCKGEAYLHGFLHKRLSKILIPLVLCSIVYSLVDITILGGIFRTLSEIGLSCQTVGSVWPSLFIISHFISSLNGLRARLKL